MSREATWFAILPVAAAIAAPAYATVYMSIEVAQQVMFPAATGFVDRSVKLSKDQRSMLRRVSGAPAPNTLRIWEAKKGNRRIGWFIIDRVLGKHEYITYAISLDTAGRVQGIEVLDYRETYGGEIRNANWRRQFVGKTAGSQLNLGDDIKNISGATLSCQHVTKGVKRSLAAFEFLFQR